MRIALLSDIHGNTIALAAVLDDIDAQGGVDAYWIAGDIAAIGYDPVGALQRVAALPNLRCVRGNTESILLNGLLPHPPLAGAPDSSDSLSIALQVAQSFAWTQGAVTAAGWLEWLAALPVEQRAVLPDGTPLLAVHASPGHDDGRGIRPDHDQPSLQALLSGCEADLVVVGHTHWPLEVQVDRTHVINLGSVSNPLAPDLRAGYVILEADRHGYRLLWRRVDYDHDAVIAAVERSRHPAAAYISAFQRGERWPAWLRNEATGSI